MESRKLFRLPGSDRELEGSADNTPQMELLSINDLARCCSEETNKFLKQSVSNDRYCLELFRRAIGKRDEDAWVCIYQDTGGEVDFRRDVLFFSSTKDG